MSLWKLQENFKIYLMIVVLFIVNVSWFSLFKFHTLMGDDLNTWIMYVNSHLDFWHYTFAQNFNDKYRPVFNAIQYILYQKFGLNYAPYFYTNILLNFLILCMFFKIVKTITSNIYIAFLFSLLFITSRFLYYNITMLTGIMEAAALFLFLMIVYHGVLFYKNSDIKHLYGAIFYYFLIIFTHERYLILAALLVSLILISKIEKKSKIISVVVTVAALLFNIILKKIAFDSSVMMGTSNETIKFNIATIAKFVVSGILNMFGLNIGPDYLSGKSFKSSEMNVQVISIIICLIVLVLLYVYIVQAFKDKRKFVLLGLTLIAIGSLIFVSSITIRQEYRWLLAPYAVVLIFLAYSFKFVKNNTVKYAVLILFVLLTLRNDHYYRGHMFNTFFIYSQVISDTAYDETVKKYGQSIGDYTIYIEKNDNINWPLLGDQLFKTYSGNDKVKVIYVDQFPAKKDKDIFLKIDWPTKRMVSVGS